MKEQSSLKKEFNRRDVQRMRNLLTGNQGDRTQVQAGWEKHSEEHKEGDVWEEGGKRWTIKNGIKQTVTKFDPIKQLTVFPLACPCCNKAMKPSTLNKKMYSIHRKCFDCVVDMETKLKAEGKYLEYERNLLNLNKNSFLTDLEDALDSWMTDTSTFISEDGVAEDWSKVGKSEAEYVALKEAIKKGKEIDI